MEDTAGKDAAGAASGASSRVLPFAVTLLLAALLPLFLRTAWLCDDALVTLRTVENFLDGEGLRWNPAERVQAYAHPLWLFFLSAWIWWSEEHFFTPMLVSVGVSLLAAVVLVRRVAAGAGAAVLAVVALAGSKAFVDYSTSGLENPFTHLLLAAYLVALNAAAPQPAPRLGLCGGLLVLNRLDLFLLVAPSFVLHAAAAGGRGARRQLAAGVIPVAAWGLFALVYYGFPLPNAAYATLGAGLSSAQRIAQGTDYLQSALRLDPLTPALIAAAVLVGLGRRSPCDLAVCAGALLYLGYVWLAGGDALAGRFLSAPFLAAVAVLVRREHAAPLQAIAVVAVLALSLASPLSPLRLDPAYGTAPAKGAPARCYKSWSIVRDERCFSFQQASLMHSVPRQELPSRHGSVASITQSGNVVFVPDSLALGFYGLGEGRERHVIDARGVTDPLLARQPADPAGWPADPLRRTLPAGYLETLAGEQVLVENPTTAACYRDLRQITRGELFSAARWAAIWRLTRRVSCPRN